MDSTRIFIAVEIGTPAKTVLGRAVKELASELENIKWIRPEQFHLTIKFIGEVDNRELPSICEKLHAACRDVEPFGVEIAGLGTYPKDKPPRVLWAGIQDGSEPLRQLNANIETAMMELGMPREMRMFNPHLTLGRVGRKTDANDVARLIADKSESIATRFDVDEVHMMTSLREHGRVVYEPLETVELL